MSLSIRLKLQRDGLDIDLEHEFPTSGITAITGPSGCGKTTLLRSIAGLDTHSNCSVSFNSGPWQSGNQFLASEKRRIGYVSQQPALFPHLSVESNIRYGTRQTNKSDSEARCNYLIAKLGLKTLLGKRPSTLSGGEQQRVSLARALASQPQLLLLDEPFSGLDKQSKDELISELRDIVAKLKIPALYVSHSLDEIAQAADQLVLMQPGLIIASGPVNAIYTRMDLPLAFQADAESVLTATVKCHHPDDHLSELKIAEKPVLVSQISAQAGSLVKLRVAARDVSLSLEKANNSSILNILETSIVDMQPSANGQMTVALDLEGQTVLAKVTTRSAESLALAIGQVVFAQVKGIAVYA